VVVLGAGTIGLLAAIAAREAGARRVIATDLLAQKRERALELGADDAVPADAPEAVPRIREILGGSADVVLDCVSSQQSIRDAISLAQNGGTVMCIGVATGLVEIPLHLVQDREIELHGSAMYTGEDIRAAIDLIEHGAFPADRIVTAVLPLEKAAEAFALAASGEEIKVAIRPTASP
jgi:threonine dehydrogenase-like Zn-dependent dehydrogenase